MTRARQFTVSARGGGDAEFISPATVANFAALPAAAANSGLYAGVLASTGTWVLGTLKPKGIYYSDGATWEYLADYTMLDEASEITNDSTVTGTMVSDALDTLLNGAASTVNSANEATDTTCFPLFITASGTQTLQPKNNTGLTYNSNTNNFGATTFTGALSGNATTVTTNANLTGDVTSVGNAATLGSSYKKRIIGFGTTSPATGHQGSYVVFPVAGTISAWSIGVDAGTCTVKCWKIATGTAVPTIADVINTSGVAIAANTYVRSTTLTDFTTTAVAAGDIFAFDLTATATATKITFALEITVT